MNKLTKTASLAFYKKKKTRKMFNIINVMSNGVNKQLYNPKNIK